MQSEKFKICIKFTLEWETGGRKDGGYTNDPSDAGGETRWGISKRSHPEEDIKNLTKERAVQIFYDEYWNPYYDVIPFPLVFKLFDLGVLFGVKTTVKMLQKTLTSQAKIKLRHDGICGPMTATAVALAKSRGADLLVYEGFLKRMRHRVIAITILKPWNLKFKRGWLNRINFDPGLNEGLVDG